MSWKNGRGRLLRASQGACTHKQSGYIRIFKLKSLVKPSLCRPCVILWGSLGQTNKRLLIRFTAPGCPDLTSSDNRFSGKDAHLLLPHQLLHGHTND